MSQPLRLSSGGLIDRAKPLNFNFDGRSYQGYEGDTLASALLANDVKLVARSFKYHHPRGILTAGSEEPNALVTLGEGAHADPNARATTTLLREGLIASSQNAWPSLEFDALAINALLSPFLPAGFYYKTFKWPSAFWETVYEPFIRRAAGLGKLSGAPDPSAYDRNHAFCDLLIIGAGPAGLSAALVAARAGLRVVLAEESARLGGRLLSEAHSIDGAPATDWITQIRAELGSNPNVHILTRTSVFGVYDGGVFAALETPESGAYAHCYWKIAAKASILAAGAFERPLLFPGNDRPGVMLASAAQSYAQIHAATPGKKLVVAASSDSGLAVATQLERLGVEIVARADLRQGEQILKAEGGNSLRAAHVQSASGVKVRVEADAVLMAGGWTPNIGLASHLGHRPVWSDDANAFLVQDAPPGMKLAGAAAGHWTTQQALEAGAAAAMQIAKDLGRTPPEAPAWRVDQDEAASFTLTPPTKPGCKKTFVDFQNDVTASDIALAAREGYRSIEHMKRYTTAGMATDQGKTSNLNAYALLASETQRTLAETGTIISRPPHAPIPIGAFAGAHRDQHFRPARRTPTQDWAQARNAAFVDAGYWRRAQYFPLPGEKTWFQSVQREVKTVRNHVGLCDVSTLGKIDVQGPDAAELLDRLYANMVSSLKVERVRYGLMLREDGFVMDDGTIARLAEDHFYVTTTTANAAKVMQHLDFARQALWPELDVQAVSVTEQWAQIAVAGPQSRALLARLLPDLDLSNEKLPFMGLVQADWCGAPIRLFRVSFSGELAYEIATPAGYGDALIRALMGAGADLGVTPYGVEALSVMRIEKGHPAGPELDGRTTAHDLGLAKLLSKKKPFIGGAMALRPALSDPGRPRLVGLKPLNAAARLRAGAHLLTPGAPQTAAHDQGWVSSVAYSPTLGHWIGLGFVRRGPDRTGETLLAFDPVRDAAAEVQICEPVFIDPEGARLRG